MFQQAVRRWVFDQSAPRNQTVALREEIAFFLHAARLILAERHAPEQVIERRAVGRRGMGGRAVAFAAE